ncbi:hypothetical protein COT72_04020 [archaeon CG10_big_fil_rev_8_21_14_0_10_43_11]|nr:MAG: hypothetical protein COT72_04020 [archaeon CG10_big_fil_rev_8_21_14_0_10_43_11]
MKQAIISFDVENLYHIPAGKKALRRGVRKDELDLDLSHALGLILDMLANHDVLATFFVVGEFAQKNQHIIKEIARKHEIASHSQTHPFLNRCTKDDFRREVVESKKVLEKISGKKVIGFRAPTFSMNHEDYHLLKQAGYQYSSSYMPSIKIPFFYGGKKFPQNMSIPEFPLSVHPVFKLPLGGAWVRLLGKQFVLDGVQRLTAHSQTICLYFHPWEFLNLASTPLPFRVRWRTGNYYQSVFGSVLDTLQDEDFNFTCFRDMLNLYPKNVITYHGGC